MKKYSYPKGKIKVKQVHGKKYLSLVTLLDSYNSQGEQEESIDLFSFKEIKEFIQATNDWRSVEDELPDKPGMYIIYVPTMDKEKPYKGMAWYEPKNTGNMEGWQLLPESFCNNITHWMPLPSKPDL